MIAVSEGTALGERLGIDPKVLQQILSVSTAGCWANNVANPRPGVLEGSPSSRNYDGGFQAGLMRKDMTLALECAEAVGIQADFTKAANEYYRIIEKAGHGSKDFGYVFQYIMKDKKI